VASLVRAIDIACPGLALDFFSLRAVDPASCRGPHDMSAAIETQTTPLADAHAVKGMRKNGALSMDAGTLVLRVQD